MKIKSDFILEKVGEAYLAVAVGKRAKSFSGLVRMNEIGAFFWGLAAERDITREELVEVTLKEYDAPRDAIERDAAAFETKLRDAGILE